MTSYQWGLVVGTLVGAIIAWLILGTIKFAFRRIRGRGGSFRSALASPLLIIVSIVLAFAARMSGANARSLENAISGCVESLRPAVASEEIAKSVCSCSMPQIMSKYSAAQMVEIQAAAKKGSPVPAEMTQILQSCSAAAGVTH